MVVVCCKAPEVPVTVTTNVLRVVEVLVRVVNVLEVVAGLGVKDAVTPLGRPDAVRVTLLLNPLTRAIAIVV